MNITIGRGKAVHATTRYGAPKCTPDRYAASCVQTDEDVTCKRCLKHLASEADYRARMEYAAGQRDTQDMDYSQAEPVEQAKPGEICFERTVEGQTRIVTKAEGLNEINGAMMGPGRRQVRSMSSGGGTYVIEYRSGLVVKLVRIQAPAQTTGNADGENGLWAPQTDGNLLHAFDAKPDAKGRDRRARCDASLRAWNFAGQYHFKSDSQITGWDRVCPRCKAK